MAEEKSRADVDPPASGEETPRTTTSNAPSLCSNKDEEKSHSSIPGDSPVGQQLHPPAEVRPDGKRELKEWECWDQLAYKWPTWKKAMYLSSIALIQISMNFNTSVFPSAVKPLSAHFGISEQAARVGQMIYLVFYSFGCELWAPWSEEFGRWPILQLSLFFINIWQIPNSVAPNFGTIVVCRALGGLSTAGGSVTLGLIADLYEPETQHWALCFIVLSSTIGTSIGGVIGGPIEKCELYTDRPAMNSTLTRRQTSAGTGTFGSNSSLVSQCKPSISSCQKVAQPSSWTVKPSEDARLAKTQTYTDQMSSRSPEYR
jgi:hypothetical protein